MISPSDDFLELRALLDAVCDESITAEQMKRLEQLVLQAPEAEAFYVQYMNLHADMIAHFGALAGLKGGSLRDRVEAELRATAPSQVSAATSSASAVHSTAEPYRSWRRYSLAVAVLAAGLVLVLLIVSRPWLRRGEEVPAVAAGPQPEVLDDSVAVLLHTTGVQWEASELPTAVGSTLPPGWLRLKSGLAHIEFYSGANVILEGPAEFQIVSRMKAYCALGKLRATVPPQAHGFEIGCPKLNLIDRGTEFGLMVSENGPTELHVF